MKKTLALCCFALATLPALAGTPVEREMVQSLVLSGALLPSQELTMDSADRTFCISGSIYDGTTVAITFVLTEDCCNWEINSCPSDETDTYFQSLVGPGVNLQGVDDPANCPRDCAAFAPDVMNAFQAYSNDGTPVPTCLPAGTYVLTVFSFSSFDPATCQRVNPGPFTVCVNCNGNGGSVGADELPSGFALAQNAPNPFNPSTEIRFSLPEAGEAALRVHDIAGREVATLVNGTLERGEHVVSFDGSALSTGVYFYTLEAAGQTTTRKMLLAK
jgi:hypothetical protein